MNPSSNCRSGFCRPTSFRLNDEPRKRKVSPSTNCLSGFVGMSLIFSRVRVIQSAFSWMNCSIIAFVARMGARTVSVPSRSMISAMVLRLLRVNLSIWICMMNEKTRFHGFLSAEGEIWTPDQGLMSPLLIIIMEILKNNPQLNIVYENSVVTLTSVCPNSCATIPKFIPLFAHFLARQCLHW